eukprot:scaffold7051_cov47-Phaeocystis_antarctica.AAC.1
MNAAAIRAGVHGGAALAPKVDDARLHPYVSYREVGAPQAAPASAATSSATRRGLRSSFAAEMLEELLEEPARR